MKTELLVQTICKVMLIRIKGNCHGFYQMIKRSVERPLKLIFRHFKIYVLDHMGQSIQEWTK